MNGASRSELEVAGDWPMIESQLPPNWRLLAEQHGVSAARVPAQLGAKVKDTSVPLRMVLHHVATNTSLKTTTAMAAAAGLIDISAVALHKWMRKFAPFLSALLLALTEAAKRFASECWAGMSCRLAENVSEIDRLARRATRRLRSGSPGDLLVG